MSVQHALRGAAVIAVAGLAMLLIGCASNATPPNQVPRCTTSEVPVCYGKRATRLEDGNDRLSDVEFCLCEPVVF